MNYREKSARRKRESRGFVNAGGALMLALLLILMLVMLAGLTLSAAENDRVFSQRLAQQKQSYYGACSQAEAVLQQIHGRISSQHPRPDVSDLNAWWQEDTVYWEVPVEEDRVLRAAWSPQTGETLQWQILQKKQHSEVT